MRAPSAPHAAACAAALTAALAAAALAANSAAAQPPSGPPHAGPPSAGAPASGPPGARVVVREDSAQRVIACRGRAVHVQGDHNTLTLRGACPRVVVEGSGNVLALDSAGTIATRGRGNHVTYLAGIGGRVPGVEDTGARNTVGPRS